MVLLYSRHNRGTKAHWGNGRTRHTLCGRWIPSTGLGNPRELDLCRMCSGLKALREAWAKAGLLSLDGELVTGR